MAGLRRVRHGGDDGWTLTVRAFRATIRATVHGIPWAAGLAAVQAVWAWILVRSFAWDLVAARKHFNPAGFLRRDASWWVWMRTGVVDTFGGTAQQLAAFVWWTVVMLIVAVVWMQALMAAAVIDRGFTRWRLPRVFVRAVGRAPALAVAWTPPFLLLVAPWWLSARFDRAGNWPLAWLSMLAFPVVAYLLVPPLLLVPAKVLASPSAWWRWPIDGVVDAWEAVSGRRGATWLVVLLGGGLVAAPIIGFAWLFAIASVIVVPLATGVLVGGTALAFGALAAAGAAVHDRLP